MSRLRVAPIVEGHGEVNAIRILLDRIWRELLGGEYIEVLKPIRQPRSKLVGAEGGLQRAVELALLKLADHPDRDAPELVLILLDANSDPACMLGPKLLRRAQEARADADISCVLANVEYETWFVAAAGSLHEHLALEPETEIPPAPEETRTGKGWIQRHIGAHKYSETLDQPRMTAMMDLALCRQRSPSFDKLCRELERRLGG